jgi:hypothetical protein
MLDNIAAQAKATASVTPRNRRAETTHDRTAAAFTVQGSIRSARSEFIIIEQRDRFLDSARPANLETRGELGY